MLGLLNSHVDPPNSLLSLCVSVFCLRGSGSEPPPSPRYMYTHTHLAGRSSGAPHSCQWAQPASFITGSEFCIWGLRGSEFDSDVVSDKLLYHTETPTGPLHIHGLIQILPLYVGSYRRLRKTPKPVQVSHSCLVATQSTTSEVHLIVETMFHRQVVQWQGCVPCYYWERSAFYCSTIWNSSVMFRTVWDRFTNIPRILFQYHHPFIHPTFDACIHPACQDFHVSWRWSHLSLEEKQ